MKERGALTTAAENTTIIIQEKGIENTEMMVAILMQGGLLTIVKKATIKVTTEGILIKKENIQRKEVFITMTVITKIENAVLKEA